MKQNNFENKVQQKLKELHIPPSDAVWEKIEKHISSKKKERRPLLFFFLFLFLAVGGYWFFTIQTNSSIKPTESIGRNEHTLPRVRGHKKPPVQGTALGSIPQNKRKGVGKATLKANESSNLKITQPNIASAVNHKLRSEKTKETSLTSKVTSQQNKKTKVDHHQRTAGITDWFTQRPMPSTISTRSIKSDQMLPASDISLALKKYIPDAKQNGKISKPSKKNKIHRWKFGITLSGGSSWAGKNMTRMANTASSPSSNYYDPNLSLSYIATPYLAPPSLKNSWAFIGGIFVQKNISPKTGVSLGLSYKYYSMTFMSENKEYSFFNQASTLSEGFYGSRQGKRSYRNSFHFLELPVSIKYQLVDNKALPVSLFGGIAVSQLISSKTLQFSPRQGIYKGDNSLFNKTQFAVQTGISVTLFHLSKHPVELGPYFIYNISNLANEGSNSGQHLEFLGIRTQILLRNK